MPLAKVVNWIRPTHQLKLMGKEPIPKALEHWREDPLNLGAYVSPHNLL